MELTERETIVKIEQQLSDSTKNQAQIVEDMRTIFEKIDQESKFLASIKSDLRAHVETSTVQRAGCTSMLKEQKEDFENSVEDIGDTVEDIKKSFEKYKEDQNRKEEKQIAFNQGIKTTIRNISIVFPIIFGLLTMLAPYLTDIIKTAITHHP
jgi:hypothetical protein